MLVRCSAETDIYKVAKTKVLTPQFTFNIDHDASLKNGKKPLMYCSGKNINQHYIQSVHNKHAVWFVNTRMVRRTPYYS